MYEGPRLRSPKNFVFSLLSRSDVINVLSLDCFFHLESTPSPQDTICFHNPVAFKKYYETSFVSPKISDQSVLKIHCYSYSSILMLSLDLFVNDRPFCEQSYTYLFTQVLMNASPSELRFRSLCLLTL